MKLAEKIHEMVPNAEMMRFSMTGAEATMSAIRIARGYTGRNKIIKFEGHYHGAHDYVLLNIVGSTSGRIRIRDCSLQGAREPWDPR